MKTCRWQYTALVAAILISILGLSISKGNILEAVALGGNPTNSDIDATALEVNNLAKINDLQTSAQQKKAKSSDDVVRELMYQYKQKHNITDGYNAAASKSFASSIRMVGVNTASPDFGKARALAFDQAYGSALKDFVKSQNNQITVESISSLFNDSSTKAREFTEEMSTGKSSVSALIDKVIALGDAITTDKLSEFGIDPAKYNAAAPDQKKILLSESFIKRTTEKSSMNLGGITPVQTFIGEDGNGNQSVGVIIMHSPKLQAVAAALRRGQKPALLSPGTPLQQMIPLNEPEKLYDLLGVRVLFDENGLVVVSYGQWSNSYAGSDPKLRSRYSSIAFGQAETLANAQISEFLNTNFNSVTSTETGEAMEQALIKQGSSGDILEPDSTTNIIDIRREVAKRKTSSLLRGASTLTQWTHTTNEGHEIVGVIKTYSFANIEASKPVTPGSSVQSGQATGRTGKEQMDLNTF